MLVVGFIIMARQNIYANKFRASYIHFEIIRIGRQLGKYLIIESCSIYVLARCLDINVHNYNVIPKQTDVFAVV